MKRLALISFSMALIAVFAGFVAPAKAMEIDPSLRTPARSCPRNETGMNSTQKPQIEKRSGRHANN
jgi:hypothetical protein